MSIDYETLKMSASLEAFSQFVLRDKCSYPAFLLIIDISDQKIYITAIYHDSFITSFGSCVRKLIKVIFNKYIYI